MRNSEFYPLRRFLVLGLLGAWVLSGWAGCASSRERDLARSDGAGANSSEAVGKTDSDGSENDGSNPSPGGSTAAPGEAGAFPGDQGTGIGREPYYRQRKVEEIESGLKPLESGPTRPQ